MMRTLLFVILISGQCFGQILKEQPDLRFPEKLDSVLLGDWYLKETIIASAYRYDSIPIIRDVPTEFKTITFTKDSLIINPWTTRFYKRNERYAYQIEASDINLFQGVKKKRQQVASYGIVKYSPRELIISTQEHLSDPFDNSTLTIYHIYHREEQSNEYATLLNKLYDKWIICSNSVIPFLVSDTSCILDFRLKGIDFSLHDRCADSLHRIELTFERDEFEFKNTLQFYTISGNIAGGIGALPFYIDRKLENIIIPGKEHLAYKIGLFDPNQLILELNKELTKELNKEYP